MVVESDQPQRHFRRQGHAANLNQQKDVGYRKTSYLLIIRYIDCFNQSSYQPSPEGLTNMHHLPALIAATIAFSSIGPALAAGSEFPARPVRMIVPYPPGGGSDITGRAIGAKLGEYLGQTFVIDNRPGAT